MIKKPIFTTPMLWLQSSHNRKEWLPLRPSSGGVGWLPFGPRGSTGPGSCVQKGIINDAQTFTS